MTITIQITAAFFPVAFFVLGFLPYILAHRRFGIYKNVAIAALHSLVIWAVAIGILIGFAVKAYL